MLKKLFTISLFILINLPAYPQISTPVQDIKQLFLDQQYDSVLQLTDPLVISDSIPQEIYYYRGIAFEELKKYQDALNCYLKAFQTDSVNIKIIYRLGNTFNNLGRTKEAIEKYRYLLLLDSTSVPARIQLANLYSKAQEDKKALIIYSDLSKYDSLNYYYLKQMGRCYQNLDSIDSALVCYSRAHQLNPYDLPMVGQMINLYLKKRDFEKGLQIVNKGLVIDSLNTELLRFRGYLYYLTGKYESAIKDFQVVIQIDSSSHFTQKYYGLSCYHGKNFTEARIWLLKAYEKDTTDKETVFFLGNACWWAAYEEEGIQYLNKTLELLHPDPKEVKQVYAQLAEFYKAMHQFDKAIDSYNKAFEQTPQDPLLLYQMANVYDSGLKDKKKAIEFYQKFIDRINAANNFRVQKESAFGPLIDFAEGRINKLKEELFFEGQ